MLVGTLHGDALISVQKADVTISSLDGSVSFTALELPAVKTFNLQPAVIDWPTEKLKYPHLADLDFPAVDFSKITMFLGSHYQDALEELETMKSTPESPGPWGIKKVFGWCVRGPLCKTAGQNVNPSFEMLTTQQTRTDLGKMIQMLLSNESFGTLPNVKLQGKRQSPQVAGRERDLHRLMLRSSCSLEDRSPGFNRQLGCCTGPFSITDQELKEEFC
jgi:hypothetical protein